MFLQEFFTTCGVCHFGNEVTLPLVASGFPPQLDATHNYRPFFYPSVHPSSSTASLALSLGQSKLTSNCKLHPTILALSVVFLDGGRKLGYLERTNQAQAEKNTVKTERPEIELVISNV